MTRRPNRLLLRLASVVLLIICVSRVAAAQQPNDAQADAGGTTLPAVEAAGDPTTVPAATTAPATALASAPAPTTAPVTAAAPPDLQPYPLAEIADRAEATGVALRRIEEELADDRVTSGIDERIGALTEEVTTRLAEGEQLLAPGPSLETLRTLEREWTEVRGQLSDWAIDLANREADLKRDDERLARLSRRWELTLAAVREAGAEPAVAERVGAIARQVGDARRRVEAREAHVRVLQGRVTAQDVRVAEALVALGDARETARTRLLDRDSPPLWTGRLGPEARQDLTRESRYSFERQTEAAGKYTWRRAVRLLLHALVVTLLAAGAARVCRRWGGELKADPDTARSAAVFEMPISTALVATLPFIPWLYPQAPRLFLAILGGAMLVPAVLVLRQLVLRPLLPLLYALIAFYAVGLFVSVTETMPALSRALFLLNMVGGVVLLAWFLRSAPRAPGFAEIATTRRWRIVRVAVRLALAVMTASAVTNALGFVSLSRLLGDAVLASAYVAIMLDACVRVADALLAVFLRLKPVAAIQFVRRHRPELRRWITTLLAWGAGLLWASVTLESLSIRRPVLDWIYDVLTARWGVGAVSLSLGGLIAFAAAVVGSFLLSRLIRLVLAEDVYPRVHLPRGIPYAISTMLHYAVLFVGFLVAVAALGYDMTKFTILAGAFGVGLGFGMQNIVNNFVSGLILLFERPIQVGDVIELDPATVGTIVRIGIRASIIRTGTAAEVIVPNGILISGRVTNWTLSNRQRGFQVPLSVGPGHDPAAVIDLLTRTARSTPGVSAAPAPQAYVTEFLPAGGLKFELRAWTDRFDDWTQARSDVVAAVNAAFAANGIQRV